MTDITVPTLGESVTEATVGQWLKSAGDTVAKDEVLVELETDKVSVEVAAPEDGVLSEIVAAEGETVEIGALLAKVGEGSGAAASSAPAAAEAPKEDAPAPAASSGGDAVEVSVPAMGESVTEGTLSSWLKKPGDAVSKDETLVEIETDKVAVEVPSPVDGVMGDILVQEGETVEIGTVIAKISGGATASAPAPTSTPAQASPAASPSTAAPAGDAPVAPSVRRIAAESGVNPADIPGTGKDGRATKGDALAYLEKKPAEKPVSAPAPATPRAIGPREERVKMTRLRQTIAKRLKEAQDNAAMLTTFNDVDMTNIMEMRKQYKDNFEKRHGVKLGFMSFFVKACVNALQEIPAVNAEIDGTDIIYKNYYDIGVAVGTEKGLVVPVVRDCDALSLAGIEGAIGALGAKARDGALSMADLQGGTFTISNGGVYGSMMSTPILNPPQSGVLGMHRIEQRPVAINGEVKIRPMMYLALSYDHRIVDGKEAVTFLVRVKEALENPERMLLGV
ncbi:MAG: dihydrolipoyllysine-residue succinyltransferase [Ponticaulis sp.]|nr:dihydrolipoyllysine-residue succinyltransferase [Ponticaulis sp.]